MPDEVDEHGAAPFPAIDLDQELGGHLGVSGGWLLAQEVSADIHGPTVAASADNVMDRFHGENLRYCRALGLNKSDLGWFRRERVPLNRRHNRVRGRLEP